MPNNINAFVSEIWSKKLALAERKRTNFKNDFTNNNWEGEIKNQGDTVRISSPDPDNIIIGDGIVTAKSGVAPTQQTLVIDKTKNFQVLFSDVETAQSQFDMIAGYTSLGGRRIEEEICLELQEEIFGNSAIETYGTTSVPIAVTKDTIYDFVVELRVKLTEKNVIDGGGYYEFKGNNEEPVMMSPKLCVTPKLYGYFLKSTQLTHPTVAGDNILQSGMRQQIAGFDISQDTQLMNVTGATSSLHPYVAGTKMGITFATQFTKVEKLRDPDSFADIVRALQLYGYKVVHPKSLIKGFVSVS